MSTQTLKDSHFNVIGYIETKADGSQIGKDSHFVIKGYYDPKSNETKDPHFKVVGHGNILASLITSF